MYDFLAKVCGRNHDSFAIPDYEVSSNNDTGEVKVVDDINPNVRKTRGYHPAC